MTVELQNGQGYDFNPRSPHGERRPKPRKTPTIVYFNPRSPHGERPARPFCRCSQIKRFQSTLPARGATAAYDRMEAEVVFQSTLPARGATAMSRCSSSKTGRFQSTLPARGATGSAPPVRRVPRRFQSTLPARGATSPSGQLTAQLNDFNPRSPHGERLGVLTHDKEAINFNPRSPHGERLRKVTILSIRIIGFAQKVYHKTVLLRISLAENAVILPEKPRNPVRTSLQKAGGLRFARAIRAARPYSISSPSGA